MFFSIHIVNMRESGEVKGQNVKLTVGESVKSIWEFIVMFLQLFHKFETVSK